MSFNTGSQELQSFTQSVCILFCEWHKHNPETSGNKNHFRMNDK